MGPARRTAALTCLLLAGLGGCVGGDEPSGEDARKGGSATLSLPRAADSLDPAVAASPQARRVLWLTHTGPLTLRHAEGRQGTELAPALARDLPEISDDGLAYRLTLRRGLRFSNGAPLRARDVAASLLRARRLGSGGTRALDAVAAVTPDDRRRRVEIRLRRADSSFAYALAGTWAGVVPARTPPRDLGDRPPPGVGAYRLARVRGLRRFVLERRRRFRLPNVPGANVDRIVAQEVPSSEDRAQQVIDGRLDAATEPPPAGLLPEVRSTYGNRYDERTGTTSLLFVLDGRRAPFDDFRVREAVNLAVDSTALARLLDGQLEPGCTVLTPAVTGHRAPDPCPWGDLGEPRDLRRAAKLIADADARGARVTVSAGGTARDERVVRSFARLLRKLGLRARVTGRPGAAARLVRLAPPVPHPSAYLRRLRVRDPSLATAVRRLEGEPDLGKSADAWAALDSELVERGTVVPLGYEKEPTFLSDRMDAPSCLRVHPVYGLDLSSLCLR